MPYRTTDYCLSLASEQEKIVTEKWLPELKTASLSAQKCLEDCKYVRGLVSNCHYQKLINFVLLIHKKEKIRQVLGQSAVGLNIDFVIR